MKEKAILFPCDREIISFIDYIDFEEYDISGLGVAEDSNIEVEFESNIPVLDVKNIDFKLFDKVILTDEVYHTHSFIKECVKCGKKIIDMRLAEKIESGKLDVISEEQKIGIPVVFIVGVTPYTEKFHVQLALRKHLFDDGYKVSQIGSKAYCNLFGFHSFPTFMSETIDNTTKILLFRKYVKYIEQQEQPNIIVIGIPGGIMSVNKKHHFDFGMTAYMISHAVEPDYVIMNMLYNSNYTEEQLEEINQTCIHKFNWRIDSFHISNSLLDPASLKSEILKFIKISDKKYLNEIGGLYDLMNPASMDKMYESMISKLASYHVNQIL